MPMTKQQALEVIKTIRHVYNIDFDRPKLETWVNILSQNGDYEPTKKTVMQYINDANHYPPSIPNIMRKEVKVVKEEPVDEKTARHRWRMKNDPEYVAQRKKILDDFRKKLSEFGVSDDE